jgi:hypothetical protein
MTSSVHSDYAAQPSAGTCPIAPLPDASYCGNPQGAGFSSASAVVYVLPGTNCVVPGGGANITAIIGTGFQAGQVVGFNIYNGGTGYQVGDQVFVTGGDGHGAYAYVSEIYQNANYQADLLNPDGTLTPAPPYVGAIGSISFLPYGLPNQMLGMISGVGMPNFQIGSVGPTGSVSLTPIAQGGVVGAFNDQVTGYYNQCLMYENQLTDVSLCLNAISAAGTSPSDLVVGGQTIGGLFGSWITYSVATSITGSLYNDFYTVSLSPNMTIASFLQEYVSCTLQTTPGGTVSQQNNIQIINSSIAPIQNNQSVANSFLNSAVSNLQSQISEFSSLLSSYYSAIQGVANNIAG